MGFKPSEEEEKYVRQEEARKLTELRGQIIADDATMARWKTLAESVGGEDLGVGRRLEELGFDAETARVLFFMPLVELAWSDGKIGYEESYKLVDELRKRGIRATSSAYEFLNRVTLSRPSVQFFDGCNELLRVLLANLPAEQRDAQVADLTGLMSLVAHASRGFFGFGSEVSKEERAAVANIVEELGLQHSSKAAELLRNLE